jgi:hypothetical protein
MYVLQEYCSILYRVPYMKIILRGEKVNTRLVERDLLKRRTYNYKPRKLPGDAVDEPNVRFSQVLCLLR